MVSFLSTKAIENTAMNKGKSTIAGNSGAVGVGGGSASGGLGVLVGFGVWLSIGVSRGSCWSCCWRG